MNQERWGRIGELFEATSSLPPAEREGWLREACGGDDRLRAEVEHLLFHDEQADRDGFLDHPEAATPGPRDTSDWSPKPGPGPVDGPTTPLDPAAGPSHARVFSLKPAITAERSADETRAVVQSRLRELMLIHVVMFAVILLFRPLVFNSVPMPILRAFGLLAATLGGLGVLLWTRRLSLGWLRSIELGMTVALASLLIVYECYYISYPTLPIERLKAEKILKNVVLLVSFLMLIEAIYVPKGWRRAAAMSGSLAILPLATLLGAHVLFPGSVEWAFAIREESYRYIAVMVADTIYLITLAGISTFAARTISRLRSEVVEARRFGQYHLGERIGAGGMGEVYLAEHEMLKRPCAVKLIRQEVVLRAGTIERFEREVRINAKLSHPNTVEIFDYGRTEDGTYYYVMEYLPGMSLADLVAGHGPLPPGRAVYLLRQVALALQEAHEAGLIHRDIKPSNIFAARRGGSDDVAKVIDFGLVRPSSGHRPPGVSDEWQILGTPLYMSPEQAKGSRSIDPRSDIYSLGAVAYYLLTGRPPFDEKVAIEALIAHARDPVIPPSDLVDGLDADLDDVVVRCLAKDPADRFPDAETLEQALAACDCASTWDKASAKRWWRDLG